ncbi:regulatory protein ICP22 [Cervid alphaherpesvirus 3]|uniref:Transcriptional regulator ICP22 homolog n=1 Tax=Cervid alphaherpesvirus 3 TaxID=2115790 RepID=A0A455JMW0_9ALPH|nr:regulatory protein ICP22 [Cervid alphaherpesvirus 3]AVT50646.1 regulatory protein ICP22 [Cervid alphaherpesvirus 3]
MSHGQPCPTCDGSCRLCRSPDRVLPGPAPRAAADDDAHARRGPGAFCPGDWRPDARRLAADVNALFRCIATGSALVSADTRALRRALLGFFLLGYTRATPTDACWEALLQLSPEQAGPLRRLLRAAAAAAPAARALSPPARLPAPLFGAECDVSGSDSSSEDYGDDDSGDDDSGDDDRGDGRGGASASALSPAASASALSSALLSSAASASTLSSALSSSASSSSPSDGEDDVFFGEPAPGPAAAPAAGPAAAGGSARRGAGRRRPAPGWRWSSSSSSGSSAAPSPAPSPGAGSRSRPAPPKRRARV